MFQDGRLHLDWFYSRDLHHRATLEKLGSYFTDTIRALVEGETVEKVASFSPTDFPLAHLNQKQVDKVMLALANKKEKIS
jgi:non-ribosomal peptide synthase protein (TIGR01720 family)